MSRLHGAHLLPDGGLRVRLSMRERDLLRDLAEQLRAVVDGEADPGGAHERLFPPAYAEPDLQEEYERLIGDDLQKLRSSTLDTFARTVERGSDGRVVWSVDLSPDQAEAWLSVVNDLRLVLGAVLGITTEGEWEQGPDADDPASVALWYLGWLEEQLVQAMMGGLGEPGDEQAP